MKLSISTLTAPKFKIIFISLTLLFSIKIKACGPDFSGYYFTWLMEHYKENNKFYPYQFDISNQFYSLSWNDEEHESKQPDRTKYNIDLWRNYLQLPLSIHDSDLKNFIYNNSSKKIANLLLEKKSTKNQIAQNIFSKNNSVEIFSYFLYLNIYKEQLAPDINEWDYDTYTKYRSKDTIKEFVKSGEKLFNSTNDVFLKWRILYTNLRAAHFNKHYDIAIQQFNQYYPKLPNDNTLPQFWCEGIYSGSLLRTHIDDKAIYYAARTFANTPDQYQYAMNTYLWSNRKWTTALPYCKNKNDSIAVTLLEGANNPYPSMEFINLVYKTNPTSPELKLLWLREAAKLEMFTYGNSKINENYLLDKDYNPINIDSIYKHRKVIANYIKIGETILSNKENLPAKVSVGNCLALFYYHFKRYQEAQNCINKISTLPKDEIEQAQYALLTNLIKFKKDNQFDNKAFIQLIKYYKKIPYGNFNQHIGHYLMYNELAPYYLAKKDTFTAFWAYTTTSIFDFDSISSYYFDNGSPEGWNTNSYASYLLTQRFSIQDIEKLKSQFLAQKGENEMQTFYIQQTKFTNGVRFFDELITKKYLLNEQWDIALTLLPKCTKEFVETMGPNPANFKINDTIEDTKTTKNNFTVKQIITLANTLKVNAQKTSDSFANDRLLYGTLLYNLSFYGKNHYILDNHWNFNNSSYTAYYKTDSVDAYLHLNGDDFYQFPMNNSFENYFYLTTAEKYLKQALPQLQSNEDKAKCVFLMAKCWQKRCPTKWGKSEYGYTTNLINYVVNSIKNPYFKELLKYKDTKIHQNIFSSCSYYEMFFKKNK